MNRSEEPLILYIDDDRTILKLAERFISNGGCRVITADNGPDGIKHALSARPNLIFLDIMMAGMDGYNVCAALQEDPTTAYIPVVFVTALDEEKDRARAFSVGAVDYLTKPITREGLLEKIEEHIKTDETWKAIHRDTIPWHKKLQSANFLQFKEFLFRRFDVDPEKKFTIAKITPANIFQIASHLEIGESTLAHFIAEFMDIPYIAQINPERVRLGVLPTAFCKSNHVVTITDDTDDPAFLLSNPFDWDLIDMLKRFSGVSQHARLLITEPMNIDVILDPDITPGRDRSIPHRKGGDAIVHVTDHVIDALDPDLKYKPTIQITNTIIAMAVSKRASDIHIEPKENNTVIRFRIDGDLLDIIALEKVTGARIITRLKALGGLDVAERRRPQDGAFQTQTGERIFNLRLSTSSTPNGESLVMRLLEPYITPQDLSMLGMSGKQTDTLLDLSGRTNGLLLVVGPTGSGKTTTIYSLLNNIDCKKRSLISVEDPIEYRIPLANQQQVNEKAGITFSSLLKTSVRQDPDILFLGEIRDEYSARVALDFASTGHLTLSSLHTSNATTAIFRLERLGVERGEMGDSILGIVAQRLIKKLCPHCKEILPISPEEIEMLSPFTDDIPAEVAHPVGCSKCDNSGYLGREGIYEIIDFDTAVQEMIRDGSSIAQIRNFIFRRGDYLLSSHALLKIRKHITSPEEAYRKVLIEDTDFRELPQEPVIPPDVTEPAATEEKQILVVEDDTSTSKIIVRLLENEGYTVSTAGDGIEALLSLGKRQFDLILSDINMPNLDGFKLLEMITQKGIKTSVVFLSGAESAHDEEKSFRLGASDYIRKPIRKDVLILRVQRVLGQSQ